MSTELIHGSLFSGLGGFDLAAEWMNWRNAFHCEIDPFCKTILKYYWPNSESYEDIKNTNFKKWKGKIDVLSGGFPCQPFSVAGNQSGTADTRYLWPEMLRAVREISPRWIVGENVRGLVSWSDGMVFDQVQLDLENEGYEVFPFLLPAAAVNAPHRRERIWFIAYSHDKRWQTGGQWHKPNKPVQSDGGYAPENVTVTEDKRYALRLHAACEGCTTRYQQGKFTGVCENVADPCGFGQQGSGRATQPGNKKTFGNGETSWSNDAGTWPTQPPVCSGNDGLSGGLDGITFSKWRQQSIKGFGNAVVPQVVLQLFKTIEKYEYYLTEADLW